jgi:hypothetical protein
MNSFMEIISSIPLYWWIVSSIGALTLVAVSIRACETERSRAKRTERNQKKELRSLAERISSYGHGVHQRYPTGDVIVSERDLAEQLRKRPDAVVLSSQEELDRRKPSYLGGVRSNGSLVYRAFSTSITSATLPSGLRSGNGLPVYLCEMASIYLQSPSGPRSTTRPRRCASM